MPSAASVVIRLAIAAYGLYLIGRRVRGYLEYWRGRRGDPPLPRDDLWENWGFGGLVALAGILGAAVALHWQLSQRTFWFFFAVTMLGALMTGWAGAKLNRRDRARSAA
jgi:uncharacterized membrane protein